MCVVALLCSQWRQPLKAREFHSVSDSCNVTHVQYCWKEVRKSANHSFFFSPGRDICPSVRVHVCISVRPQYICSSYCGGTASSSYSVCACVWPLPLGSLVIWSAGFHSLFLCSGMISSVSKLWAGKLWCITTRLTWTVKDSTSSQQSHCWSSMTLYCAAVWFAPSQIPPTVSWLSKHLLN